jgi:hypothetical protein
MTTETKPNQESSWHRPNLYITIVALYLSISLAIVLAAGWLSWYPWYTAKTDPDAPGAWAVGFAAIGIPIVYGFVSMPSIAASILLLRKQKSGIYISVIALALTALALPITIGLLDREMSDRSHPISPMLFYFLFYSAIASAVVMYPLLIFGWKKIEWRS